VGGAGNLAWRGVWWWLNSRNKIKWDNATMVCYQMFRKQYLCSRSREGSLRRFFALLYPFLCEIMKPFYLLPLISVIILQPSIAHALTPEQIQKVARSVVLKISVEGEEKSAPIFGSGVLIRKNGTTYTLVTNAHVVCTNGSAHNCKKHKEFSIMTPDQKRYKVRSTAVKNLPGLDLSTIQFQSDRNYSVASFGDSETVKVDDTHLAFPQLRIALVLVMAQLLPMSKIRLQVDIIFFTMLQQIKE
jgi:S1-C subfamily serine protease